MTTEGLDQIWTKKLNVKPEVGYINEFDFNKGETTRMKGLELKTENYILWEYIT